MNRSIVMFLVLLVSTLPVSSIATAQDYPGKRITLITPVPPGGSADAIARIFADHLRERLGQPVVVDNRAGAGGVMGTDALAGAPPDGYTIGVLAAPVTTPKELLPPSNFKLSDFAPLAQIASAPFLIVVPADLPAKTLKEFITLARATPGKLNYGTIPNNVNQLDMIRFSRITQTNIADIPFNGAAPIVTALLGGQIQMALLGSTAMPHIQSGKLLALAVASKSRWSGAPEVPTAAELGVDFDATIWFGLGAPSATPPAILSRLVRDIGTVAKLPILKESVRKLALDPIESTPQEFANFLRSQLDQNIAIAKSVGIAK